MRIQAKIQKWGNGLALRVSGLMRDIPHFEENMKVNVEVTEQGLYITKARMSSKLKLPYTEKELLQNISPASVHAEFLTPLFDKEVDY